MKRLITVIISATSILLSTGNVYAEEGIMELVRDANANSTYQESGRTIAYSSVTYDAAGEEYIAYAYLDPEQVIYDCDDYIEINKMGDVYGRNKPDNTLYRYLFVDDSAKDREIQASGYAFDPEEIVTEEFEQDGNLIVRTVLENEIYLETYEYILSYYGYEIPDSFQIINEYTLDAETYEIKHFYVYVVIEDEDIVFIENTRVDDPEVFEVDPEIIAAVNSEDQRVLTVIADPGTDEETIYKQTMAKGCIINFEPSMEHPNLYTDEACTQPYIGGTDLEDNHTLYTIRE